MPDFSPILRNIGKYINLSPDEQNYFTSLLKFRKLKKKQFLVQAFDHCKYESFVLKGCLKEYFTDENGKDYIVRFVMEDYWTSDVESFLKGTEATLNIEALEDCELLQIDYPSLELLFSTNPKFERFYRIAFQESYISFQNRIISSLAKSAEERYADFLHQHKVLAQRIPQHQIAAYLGVSPEFLSKIRQNIARK
jgi:CRP-like cAMP-binding protein